MKKILSFICALVLLCTVLVPLTAFEASAAAKDPWKGWAFEDNAKVVDGVLVSKDYSRATMSFILPDKYTMSFSMKVNAFGGTMAVYAMNGVARSGFYVRNGNVRAMDNSSLYLPYFCLLWLPVSCSR